jgi:LuxR family maltose regulon positive regulatory protein
VNRPDDAAAADPALADCFAAPRLPDGFVRRPRLIRLAAGALSRPLLLITGPAGAGKSLLAAEWSAAAATRRAGLVAWYTAEPGDDAPGVFWPRLLEALRQAGLDVPADPAAAAPSGAVTSSAARLAAFLTASPRPVILIIDQFERAGGRDVAAGLDFLLAHAAARLRLVLISRSEPLLALHRYRASGEIAEIRAADLAFRLEEAARLLRREGLCVPDDAVRALWRRTEGWAAGLRLSALAAKHADDPEVYIKEFEAGEAAVADFVLAEVLATQPAEVQDLLLRTSIVERTHVGLADALTGRHDAARILEDLAHENAFVELIGHRWYRSHRLFAEILRHRLRARDPVLEADLHRRAARWLGEHDLLGDALAHWAAAGDWDLAADRLVAEPAIGRLLVGLDAERLRRLFAGMPREASGTGPELVRAGLALARQDAERAVVHLDRAAPRPSPSAAGTDAPAPGVELTQAVLRVLAAALTGCADDAQHRAADADALECQTPDAAGAGHPELPRLVHAALGSACLWEGRFDAARTAFLRAIDLCADAADAAATRQDARGRLALIDQLRGTLGRAQARAGDVLADAARGGAPPTSGTAVAHLVLARAAFERDELDASRAGLEHAAEAAPDEHDPIVRAGSAVLRARLLLAEGDPAAALDALAPAIRPPGRGSSTAHPSPWAAPEAAEAAAEAHLALGDAPAARDAASREASHDPACAVALARAQLAVEQDGEAARATLESTGPLASSPPPVAVRALLVGACVARQAGDEPAAMRRLAQALDVARPDRLCRPFRETLPWVAHALRTHPTLSRGHTWLPHDLRAAPQPEPVPGAALVEPLSGREREVLERAAQMMSTTEIADDLWLSVNTVKTHLKNINRKLCTTRRAEAVRRARDLRML